MSVGEDQGRRGENVHTEVVVPEGDVPLRMSGPGAGNPYRYGAATDAGRSLVPIARGCRFTSARRTLLTGRSSYCDTSRTAGTRAGKGRPEWQCRNTRMGAWNGHGTLVVPHLTRRLSSTAEPSSRRRVSTSRRWRSGCDGELPEHAQPEAGTVPATTEGPLAQVMSGGPSLSRLLVCPEDTRVVVGSEFLPQR